MEMTTKEIFDGLKGTDVPADIYPELKELFERADYVKFAKYVATDDENAAAVPLAVRFVTSTYQSEVNADSTEPLSGQQGPLSGQYMRSEGSAPAAVPEEQPVIEASDKKEN